MKLTAIDGWRFCAVGFRPAGVVTTIGFNAPVWLE